MSTDNAALIRDGFHGFPHDGQRVRVSASPELAVRRADNYFYERDL